VSRFQIFCWQGSVEVSESIALHLHGDQKLQVKLKAFFAPPDPSTKNAFHTSGDKDVPHQREAAMESQTQLLESMIKSFRTFKDGLPDVGEAYDHLPAEVYKDGALKGKTKRLMALATALTHGCPACVLFQAEEALKLGASVDEVLECCAVAVSIGGTMATSEITRVVQFLKEKDLM
jgi:AhpD family alkylhydroperoxidase